MDARARNSEAEQLPAAPPVSKRKLKPTPKALDNAERARAQTEASATAASPCAYCNAFDPGRASHSTGECHTAWLDIRDSNPTVVAAVAFNRARLPLNDTNLAKIQGLLYSVAPEVMVVAK